jgi:Transglycosylase-like domain
MPETSGMASEMRKAGEGARKAFHEGFGSGNDADRLGASFANKFAQSFAARFKTADLGLVGSAVDKLSEQVDANLASKLKSQLPAAYNAATEAANRYGAAQSALAQHEAKMADLTDQKTRATTEWRQAQEAAVEVSQRHQQALQASNYDSETENRLLAEARPLLEAEHAAREHLEAIGRQEVITQRQRIPLIEQANSEHAKAAAAQENLTEKTHAYNDASAGAFSMSNMFAGALGGAVVLGIQGVVGGMEHLAELGAHIFEDAIQGAGQLAKELIDVGEQYQHLNISITEFSGASGEALDRLQASAATVFNGLDVAGKDTGQTLATFNTRLGLSGTALEQLTTHVERLEGRFKDLRGADLATAFSAIGVDGTNALNVLASWVQSARNAGESTGTLVRQLAQVGDTLRPELSGLTPEQLGSWIAQITEKVPNATQVITGLSTAEKVFAEKHLDFASGLKEAAKEINAAGSEADKEDLAEHLFGTRKWAGALDAVRMYLDVVRQGPDAVAGNVDALTQFEDATADLENKIEEFKHHLEGSFAPLAKDAKDAVEHGLNIVSNWFDHNHDRIITDVEKWGNAFIDTLPVIRDFASGAVAMLGPFIDTILKPMAVLAMQTAGAFEIATGHFGQGWDLLKSSQDVLTHDYGKDFQNFSDKIDGIKLDTDKMKQNFDGMLDSSRDMPEWVGSGIMPPSMMPANMPPSAGPSNPDAFQPHWSTGQNAPQLPASGPASNPLLPSTTLPSPGAPGGGPPLGLPSGYSASSGGVDWNALAQLESSGNWSDNTGNGFYGGLQFQQSSWVAAGGLQYAPRADEAQPWQQVAVAQRLLAMQGPGAWPKSSHDHPEIFGGAKYAATGGESTGNGMLAKMLGNAGFGPKGKDTVLSYYAPGEFVWDAETVDKYGPLIKALHGGGRYFDKGGGLNTQGAQTDTIAIAQAVSQAFGITDIGMYRGADGYNEHSSGEAADVMVGTDNPIGNAVKDYALQYASQFGVEYAIWQNKLWYPDGHSENYGADPNDVTQSHRNHVHIRTAGGGFPQGGGPGADFGAGLPKSGSTSATPAPAAMGLGSGGFGNGSVGGFGFTAFGGGPGLPGQYGGYGAYNAETYDQAVQAQRSVEGKEGEIKNLNREIEDKKSEIDQYTTELGQLQSKPELERDDKAIEAKKRQLQRAQEDLDDLTNRRKPEAEQDLTEAQRKQQEAYYKSPSKGQQPKATGEDAFRQLGGSLMGGIAQSLGFPDVFGGKAPWDWGITKLMGGLANWGMGELGAIGSASGDGSMPSGARGRPFGIGGFNIPAPGAGNLVRPGVPGVPPSITPGIPEPSVGYNPATGHGPLALESPLLSTITPSGWHGGGPSGGKAPSVSPSVGKAPSGGGQFQPAKGGAGAGGAAVNALSGLVNGAVQLVGALGSDLDPTPAMQAAKQAPEYRVHNGDIHTGDVHNDNSQTFNLQGNYGSDESQMQSFARSSANSTGESVMAPGTLVTT